MNPNETADDMTATELDELTIDDLRDLTEGDRVEVTYESVYGDLGNEQAFTATVLGVEVDEWVNTDAADVTVDLAHEGDDDRADVFDDIVETRRLSFLFYEGEVGTVDVETRNGARWHRLARHGSDSTLAVVETADDAQDESDDETDEDAETFDLAAEMYEQAGGDASDLRGDETDESDDENEQADADETREAVTVYHVDRDAFDDDREFAFARDDVRSGRVPVTEAMFERMYAPAETVLDTTDPSEAYEQAQGHVVNREQDAVHMVPSASAGDVFEVRHADGSTEWFRVARIGFEALDFSDDAGASGDGTDGDEGGPAQGDAADDPVVEEMREVADAMGPAEREAFDEYLAEREQDEQGDELVADGGEDPDRVRLTFETFDGSDERVETVDVLTRHEGSIRLTETDDGETLLVDEAAGEVYERPAGRAYRLDSVDVPATDGGESPAFEQGDRVEDVTDDEDDRADLRVYDADAGRAGAVEVGTTGTTVAEYGPNADLDGVDADDRVVSVAFESWLDSNVPEWREALVVDDGDLRAFLDDYADEWGVAIRTYDYPESRLTRAESDDGVTRPHTSPDDEDAETWSGAPENQPSPADPALREQDGEPETDGGRPRARIVERPSTYAVQRIACRAPDFGAGPAAWSVCELVREQVEREVENARDAEVEA
ncbi:hypothetical protein HrrHc1_230 [Halorubrum phage Hardycor1]|nr:hypothetical protein HrrHc1_230 [Halorubrum phage Hardycor1]